MSQLAVDFRTIRQIHLDFHTPGFVPVGEGFDRNAFFDTLQAAEVNSIAVFAHCHHGYAYFDTEIGVRHPGLHFDLLGAIAEEARARSISLLAYFSQNVNEVQAAQHPDWHALWEDGTSVNSQILQDGSELFWTWLCPNRTDWIDTFFLPHIAEVLRGYPIDGIFVDMPGYLPGSCHCPACLQRMRAQGLDPANAAQHSQFNAETNQGVAIKLRALMDSIVPGLRLEMGPFNAFGQAEKARGVVSELYLESLAFQTGWQYFPLAARYFRKYGLPTIGMTGRFLKNWGDFGTVASPRQLNTTLAMHLMAGMSSCIGDHMPCTGQLDTAVYEIIGESYRFIKARQPYCVGMTPAREVAVRVPDGVEANAATAAQDSPFATVTDAYKGACKMLTELHYQYELLSSQDRLDGYHTLIVTDGFFTRAYADRVRAFVEAGGLLVVSGHGLNPTDADARAAWHDLLGITDTAISDHQGEFYQVTDPCVASGVPAMPNYLHIRAIDVAFGDDVTALAEGWRSPNLRSREAHYGHFHGPATAQVGPSIATRTVGQGRVIVIAPQLFAAYLGTGYFAHRLLLRNLLDAFLPARALRTNAPTLVEFALGTLNGVTVLQVLPFVVERRDRYSFESICDDPISFRDIWVELPRAELPQRVFDPVTGRQIRWERIDDGIRLYLPDFDEHLVVHIA